MIVLGTHVILEAMKPETNPAVRAWLNEQSAETLYLSSVTLAALLFGIAALPNGKREDMLNEALGGLTELFRGRILSFDADAAHKYAELAVTARTAGRGFPVPDGYIAVSQGYQVASRDMASNVEVINPWET
ncbi:PIN domain-containing protein [Halomonas sp. HAL1]|uniref:PIN domain-containing protein n=1 Tax=Halomonas sp. HAL1 TaxID=550984 RepID=UPI00022D33B8|nr:PIN domain-containing protein [Halomonas sp. HAL1]EHA15927.1 PilT domain-containing protein [Halomonas sp. HAL1]WKV93806.1 PIN domain-containing protein [Halomonas sp. HAL1]